ncbi:MAG TPA: cation diffusion facilitator family transporter [Candidatus Acidoferrales bacterium]|nr:cation diffusion facilitator family transporter [Candidatus Acidoferrales bacterium]
MGIHVHGRADHPHPSSHVLGAMLGLAVVATFVLVLIELLAGYAAHSMALVSDAVHNLTDVPTLVISWLAMRWALRPPTHEKTYGYHRSGILAAFVNAMLLSVAALFVIGGSMARLHSPVEVRASLMLWVAVLALVVNGGITLSVHRARSDLNVRTVWIHNLGDALSNIGILVGALLIRWTGAQWIDAAIGIAIGGMVLWSAQRILRESGHILLEGLPRGMRLENVVSAVLAIEGAQEVHDVHIWTLGGDLHALSCHVRIPDMHMEESEKILTNIREVLARDFHITHTTIQFERAGLPAKTGLYMPAPAGRSAK